MPKAGNGFIEVSNALPFDSTVIRFDLEHHSVRYKSLKVCIEEE